VRVLAVGSVYPPHHLGGYEVIERGVNEELRRQGHTVRVLVTTHRQPDVQAPDDPDVHRELWWYWRDHAWPDYSFRQRLAIERHNARVLEAHLQELQPDVIAWWVVGGMSLSLIERARRAGIPAVFFVLDYWPRYGPQHDLWIRMWSPRWRAPLGLAAERFTGIPARLDLAGAGHWVFCSESMRQGTLEDGLPIPATAQTLLAPGIERRFLDAPRAPAQPWCWQLLYLGRVVEQKGVETAIEALALLPAEATLRIVGPGDQPYRQALERRAAELGVLERVMFAAPVGRDETLQVYREADALLFPVVWDEPFGLVPLEAMALGVPVVATGRGGSGDFLSDGTNSLLFEAGNADALAAVIRRLADQPELRERLREGGFQTAAQYDEDSFNSAAVAELAAATTTTTDDAATRRA
jgi:glycogen synthase